MKHTFFGATSRFPSNKLVFWICSPIIHPNMLLWPVIRSNQSFSDWRAANMLLWTHSFIVCMMACVSDLISSSRHERNTHFLSSPFIMQYHSKSQERSTLMSMMWPHIRFLLLSLFFSDQLTRISEDSTTFCDVEPVATGDNLLQWMFVVDYVTTRPKRWSCTIHGKASFLW